MNQKVREMIEGCSSCQAVGISNLVQPMKIAPTEDIPRYHIGIDFLGPMPNSNQYLLVVLDTYAKFPEVEIVHSTSIQAIIPKKLVRIFATHSISICQNCHLRKYYTSTKIQRKTLRKAKKNKENCDKRHHWKESNIRKGDIVICLL